MLTKIVVAAAILLLLFAVWFIGTGLVALLFMWAFNLTAPAFGWPLISWSVAFGAVVLIEIVGSAFRAIVRK